jgi:hemerythrin-like metal-binding protein
MERTANVELHHRVQLGLLAALEAQLEGDLRAPPARETMERLLDFTRVHFQAEELLMRLHRYPQRAPHVAAHARMLAEAIAVGHAHGAGERATARAALARLRSWVIDHLRGLDAAYEAWCARSGIALE